MAEQDLSTSQLDPLPLPIQASDVIHVARGGQDYRVERSELVRMFLSMLSDAAISSAINGQSLVFSGTTSKWQNDFVSWATISGKPGTFQPTAHTHIWDEITDAPTSFPAEAHTHAWIEITDKPTSFPPQAHDHNTAYYTKTQLSTSGTGAQVHWENIINVPELGTGSGDMAKSVYDQDNDGIVDAAAVVPWSGITGKPATFTPEAHIHLWADITDKPATFTPASHTHLWTDITDTPSEFTPEAHTHLWADITDKPATFPAEPHNHDSFYFRKDELTLPSGGGTVHWDNVTNTPSVFPPAGHNHNNLYSLLEHNHDSAYLLLNQITNAVDSEPGENNNTWFAYLGDDNVVRRVGYLTIRNNFQGYFDYRYAEIAHNHGSLYEPYNQNIQAHIEAWSPHPGHLTDVPAANKVYGRKVDEWVSLDVTGLAINKIPSGSKNGVNTVFTTVANFITGSLRVYLNGQRLVEGVDYTENVGGFNMMVAPVSTDALVVDYNTNSGVLAAGENSQIVNEVPAGAVDGVNTVFTFSQSYFAGSTLVYRDGQLMNPGGNDYTETDPAAGIITFVAAPVTDTTILGSYRTSTFVSGNADTVDGKHASEFALAAHTHVAGDVPTVDTGWKSVSHTWTFASSQDAPVYRIYATGNLSAHPDYKPANRIKCINNGGTAMGIIVQRGSYDSANNRTPIDVFCGTDFVLSASPITNPYISKIYSPDDFPLEKEKWSVSVIVSDVPGKTTPAAGTWYGGSLLSPMGPYLDVPIGSWGLSWEGLFELGVTLAAAASVGMRCSLSTAENAQTDAEFTVTSTLTYQTAGAVTLRGYGTRRKNVTLSAKTRYYIVLLTGQSNYDYIRLNAASAFRANIRAVCAYL